MRSFKNKINVKIFFYIFCLIFFPSNSFAKKTNQYPNLSGDVLFELRLDRILSSDKQNINSLNGAVIIEPKFSLNLNKNWFAKSNWKIAPISQRDTINPERSRTFLSDDRGLLRFDEQGVIIEELKGFFENEDMRFFFGKFNPSFGTAWRKEKRIGVFTTDFTEDYELREKIGFGITALLEDSELTFNTFFNDNSGLSDSGIKRRGRDGDQKGVAGNTSTLSSYSVTLEGRNLLEVDDLYYSIGYRNLDVDETAGKDNEEGLVASLEYLVRLGNDSSLIPFFEIAKISNMSGEANKDSLYTTAAIIMRYSRWNFSISTVMRNIDQANSVGNVNDKQMQYSVGYKFQNNVALDVSRISLQESNKDASILGVLLSYVYEF